MCQPVPAAALATAAGKPQPQVIILNAAGQPTVIQAQTAVAQVGPLMMQFRCFYVGLLTVSLYLILFVVLLFHSNTIMSSLLCQIS